MIRKNPKGQIESWNKNITFILVKDCYSKLTFPVVFGGVGAVALRFALVLPLTTLNDEIQYVHIMINNQRYITQLL